MNGIFYNCSSLSSLPYIYERYLYNIIDINEYSYKCLPSLSLKKELDTSSNVDDNSELIYKNFFSFVSHISLFIDFESDLTYNKLSLSFS